MRYLIVVGLLVLPLEALAQLGGRANPTDRADRRVAQALRAAGYSYTVDDDGDYAVTVRFREDNRTQLVWIASSTREIAGAEVRRVWSPAYKSTKPLSASLARRLLEENLGTGIGYWAAAKQGARPWWSSARRSAPMRIPQSWMRRFKLSPQPQMSWRRSCSAATTSKLLPTAQRCGMSSSSTA
jgi:hypothetical protein